MLLGLNLSLPNVGALGGELLAFGPTLVLDFLMGAEDPVAGSSNTVSGPGQYLRDE